MNNQLHNRQAHQVFRTGPTKRNFYLASVCLVAALGGLLFGYDTAVISGAIGFLQSHFKLTPTMKGWAASSALLGCIMGCLFAGAFSDRLGRKRTLILAALLFLVSSVGTAVPERFWVFVLFRILAGVAIGVASFASPMYIAEISPPGIRGRMVSVNQFAIISGMLVIYFVNYAIARPEDPAWNEAIGWRWMFGSGCVPAGLFLGFVFLVPESPRWLVEHGRVDDARLVLERINPSDEAARELAKIQETLRLQPACFSELLGPGLRRPMLIGIGLAILQQITGINVFLYYAPEIFKQLGSGIDAALLQTIVVGAVNLLFTIGAIWTVDLLGRKPLMMVGAAGMGLCLVGMGIIAQGGQTPLAILAFILGYIAFFALSVGPVTWVLLSEIYPTRFRGRAMSVATVFLWSANFVVSQTFPMMDENAWLVKHFNHAFPFYLYAAFCAVLVLLVWRTVPETKGRSLEEIEKYWLDKKRTFQV
ncbi:MAG: sugar porter family MFS transporter [Verrucomicrobiae bacterium]|nr:sugar porter family MFS transporter [Verrucomicrobiae bacterium]